MGMDQDIRKDLCAPTGRGVTPVSMGRLQWAPLVLCTATLGLAWLARPPGVWPAVCGAVGMLAVSWMGTVVLRRALRAQGQRAADALAALELQCQQQRTVPRR
ncbi:hypothetical protein [Rhodoferax sp.]|uniref:hypothetical protein n=1 Tax=Rhodoferax sp. TaxID=50421 RepID=UPI003263B49F